MIEAGHTIGNYRILSKIGIGGMGAVYLAEHPLIGKRVALKVIHRELVNNREVVQRFFQEARAVNQIGNEHIVEIHDFGMTPDNVHFFIMEYLEGKTLASILSREGTLAPQRALYVGAQIAHALAAAHAAGVIHRDLKPDNVMLTLRLGDPDFVKVLDFGLAKIFSGSGASAMLQTAAGVLLGTPQYMSPEACESRRDVDHRTDVYALGILLFQMLTGVLPFDGTSMADVLVQQVTALPPAPRGINPDIPPSIEQVVLRCLAKPVEARFPTMDALRAALLDPEAYLRGSPPLARARSVAPGEANLIAPQAAYNASAASDDAARVGARTSRVLPAETQNHTMTIPTPRGYSSRARKVWPIVLVSALLVGLGGGAFAVAWFDRDGRTVDHASGSAVARSTASSASSARTGSAPSAPSATAAIPRGSAGGSAGSAGAGSAGAGSADVERPTGASPSPPTFHDAGVPDDANTEGAVQATTAIRVRLAIDSVPSGAAVYAPGGALLGKTPLRIEWPSSTRGVTFELELAGHRRSRQVVVSGDTAVTVMLAPRRVPPRRGASDGNGLERPD